MKSEYKKNVNGVYLVLEDDGSYTEDYQLRMIAANDIPGILRVKGRELNERSRYYYAVSGKVTMKSMYDQKQIGYKDLRIFLQQFLQTAGAVYEYMLDMNRLLLDPKYIFYEEEHFYFCYYPPAKEELGVQLHRISEYLVRQVNYDDKDAIYTAYQLHKRTMEDNYSIEQVIKRALGGPEKETEGNRIKESAEYQTAEEENEFEPRDQMEAESNNLVPLRFKQKIFSLRKKPKWGDWDGFHIVE